MGTTYREADPEVMELLEGVLHEFFPKVAIAEPPLQIRVLFAENEKGCALKKFGRGTVAVIKRGSTEQRSTPEGPDLWILIDAERWARSNERRQRAILAHECHHIEIPYEPDNKTPKTDDHGRIRVRLTPDDWVLTGFRDVVEWFGEDAVEREGLTRVEEYLKQLTLPFPDHQAAVNRRVAEIEREEAGEGDVVRDAFAALLSVGHTEQQARAAIDGVLESGRTFRSVASLIDAVYEAAREPALAS